MVLKLKNEKVFDLLIDYIFYVNELLMNTINLGKLRNCLLISHKKRNLHFLLVTILSGTFLGLCKNEDDLNKAIFYVPCVSYLYIYAIIKRPWIIIIYLLSFYISKKIKDL